MIRQADRNDLVPLAELALLLWPKHSLEDLVQEFSDIMSQKDCLFLLKYVGEEAVGFAQCQLRCDYVQGCHSSPVGYLEGIFVKEGCRGRGYAKELVQGCQAWAKEKACTEFASDCELENELSIRFHRALHFREAGRIVCFTKSL